MILMQKHMLEEQGRIITKIMWLYIADDPKTEAYIRRAGEDHD